MRSPERGSRREGSIAVSGIKLKNPRRSHSTIATVGLQVIIMRKKMRESKAEEGAY